jgi:transcriptional regulator with XRE-family HTH domain
MTQHRNPTHLWPPERILALRERLTWSSKQMARAIGVTPRAFKRWICPVDSPDHRYPRSAAMYNLKRLEDQCRFGYTRPWPVLPAEHVGEAIRQIRLKYKKTQAYIAGKVGCTPGYISGIELGNERPTPEMLGKIASVLGTTAEALAALVKPHTKHPAKP